MSVQRAVLGDDPDLLVFMLSAFAVFHVGFNRFDP